VHRRRSDVKRLCCTFVGLNAVKVAMPRATSADLGLLLTAHLSFAQQEPKGYTHQHHTHRYQHTDPPQKSTSAQLLQ